MTFDTAGQVINDALVEVGLSAVSDPFAETEANVVQMCSFLKSLGRELIHENDWTILRKEATFTTVQGTPSYALPTDFHNMIDQSGWNRTNRLPLGGPLSPQEWQYLKARLAGVVFTVLFRPMEGQIFIYPDNPTPGGYTIAYEYKSKGWVKIPGGGGTFTYRDYPSQSTDIIQYDTLLVSRGLKLAWLRAHGFDTTNAQRDFDKALMFTRGQDSYNPKLSLANQGPMRGIDQLIGNQSVPITGFGS